MPPKTVKCEICSEQVTKRKSLAFGNGRACRDHPEVIKMVEDAIKEEKMVELNNTMNLIMAVSWVRVNHSVRGIPYFVLIQHIREKRGRDFTRKVEDKIQEMGGPKLSVSDLITSMLSHGQLFIKKKLGG